MLTKYKLAKKLKVSVSHVSEILNRKEYASLPTALKIEKATHGEVKVEDIVRPEIRAALREYLSLRMSKTSHNREGEESGKNAEEVTVE